MRLSYLSVNNFEKNFVILWHFEQIVKFFFLTVRELVMWTVTFYLSPIEMIEGTCNQVFYQSALTAVRVKLRENYFIEISNPFCTGIKFIK